MKHVALYDQDALDAALAPVLAEVRALRQELATVALAPKPRWLTVKDYAVQTGASESTINRKVRAGKLASCEIGGRRMVKNPDAT